MFCIKCMQEIDRNCIGCEEFESTKTHALNLAKSIELTIKRNKQPELSGKDWAFICASLGYYVNLK